MMRFPCPHCKASVSAPEEKAGARVYCPRCREPFQVPGGPKRSGVLPAPPLPTVPPVQPDPPVSEPPPAPPVPPTQASLPAPTPLPSPPSQAAPGPPRPARSFLAFVAGLIVGALLGGGVVWAVFVQKWGD